MVKLIFCLFLIMTVSTSHAVELAAADNIEVIGEKKISDVIVDDDDDESDGEDDLEVSKFGRLDPFESIVVLQRRYLPKRRRFEANLALGFLSDNPFFVTTVFHGRLGYSFTEALGLEASFFQAATSESQVSKNLLDGGISSEINDVPESYLGLDFKWTPMYGKIAFFNKSIIPIDNYYLLGVGQINLAGDESPIALHTAAGLSFSLKRWLALRLEFAVYAYSTENSGSYTDSHFSLGLSAFFPGVDRR